MIDKKIKFYRLQKHMTQEELAEKLNVVRQTVSKWENGQSVPDADVLLRIAEILEVSVNKLLGTQDEIVDVNEKLARLNNELAKRICVERKQVQINQKRQLILFWSFLALLMALVFSQSILSLLLVFLCVLMAFLVLYRNLALLTDQYTSMSMKSLHMTTRFTIVVVILAVILAFAFEKQLINENLEDLFVAGIVSSVMLFAGYVAPKLPFSRHTGLRLPWTISDEATWHIAHRIIGYISLPMVLVYFAIIFMTFDIGISTAIAFLAWLLIPSLLSLLYYFKRF